MRKSVHLYSENSGADQLAVRVPCSCLISAFILHMLKAGPFVTPLKYETSANALLERLMTSISKGLPRLPEALRFHETVLNLPSSCNV